MTLLIHPNKNISDFPHPPFSPAPTFPSFVVPIGTATVGNVAPRLAMSFGTAGLYFYYSSAGSSPSQLPVPVGPLACGANTYGSIAVNTASLTTTPDIFVCAASAVDPPAIPTYAWENFA
jgi:hypothetical protein